MSEEKKDVSSSVKTSSIGWGLGALFTAWLGLIGLVLGIVAMVKGFSKKSSNTANGVLGIIAVLLSVGAIIVQLTFGLALLFGSRDTDLGVATTRQGITGGGVSYTVELPSKFTKETKTDDGERYLYRKDSTGKVLAVALVSCGYDGIANNEVKGMLDTIKNALDDSDTKGQLEREVANAFGGVNNLRMGDPEDFTSGYYADRAFAVSLYGEHPSDKSELYGEAHILVDKGNMCSATWMGTRDIHEANEKIMDTALTSFRVD